MFFTRKRKRSMAVQNFFFTSLSHAPFLQAGEKDKKVKLHHFFPRKRIEKYLSFYHRLLFFLYSSLHQDEKKWSPKRIMQLYQKPLRRCQSSVRGWWEFILVKDSGGYASVRSSLLCSGEREVGDAEVDAGHRRQQTGSNWREPASLSPPTAASRWRGSWRPVKERRRERRKETLRKRDIVYANNFIAPYIARSRVSIPVESIQARPGRNETRYRVIVIIEHRNDNRCLKSQR